MKNKDSWRQRLFDWALGVLHRRGWYNDSQYLRWYHIALRYLIMPLNTLHYYLHKKTDTYDAIANVYTINGIRYHGSMFCELGIDGMPIGSTFMLIERKDGVVTIVKMDK